jgi:phosphate starvation-inducible PhoH-like protein
VQTRCTIASWGGLGANRIANWAGQDCVCFASWRESFYIRTGSSSGGPLPDDINETHAHRMPRWRLPIPLKIALEITPNLEPLFGTRDENLRLMEDKLGVRIDLRSDAVHVEGPEEGVARVQRIFQDFEALRKQGVNPHNGELNGMLRLVVADAATTLRSLSDSGKQRSAGVKRTVQPRSINQRKYVEAIEQNDMTFGVGPAGTGKTYLAVAMAVAAYNAKKVSRIVLVRPAVEAGEKLGFLPGSLQEKVDPYLRPLYDALYDLLEPDKVDKMLEKNVIEVAPLAFMRGRTLNDAFIIMDEAQNTTIEQMKMFLTRMGANSKAVITGDITQIDLPNPRKSGLIDAINVLDGVEGIHFCHFVDSDVVRHALVQRIVRAYESAKPQQQELPLGAGEAIDVRAQASEERTQAQGLHVPKPQ